MPDIKELALAEAERQLKMNLSLIAMLKGNTPDEVIADFREEWLQPWEEAVVELESRNVDSIGEPPSLHALADPVPPSSGVSAGRRGAFRYRSTRLLSPRRLWREARIPG